MEEAVESQQDLINLQNQVNELMGNEPEGRLLADESIAWQALEKCWEALEDGISGIEEFIHGPMKPEWPRSIKYPEGMPEEAVLRMKDPSRE